MAIHDQWNTRNCQIIFIRCIAIMTVVYLIISIPESYKEENRVLKYWRKNWKTSKISDIKQAEIISEKFPNIPIDYWIKIKDEQKQMFYKNSTCAPFPDMQKLDVNNLYWQTVYMNQQTTVQLYSAFYDTRQTAPGIDVKILGMVNRTNDMLPADRTFYCQLWFDNEKAPVISKIAKNYYIWYDYWKIHKDGELGPYLLSCPIPKSHQERVPKVVSLVENPCDNARNLLTVIYNRPKKQQDFAVCVKGLDFLQEDLSVRLIEWIEFILNMGAKKIHFYQLSVHPNIQKVLDYYTKLGKIYVSETTLPPGNPNIPLVQHMFIEQKRSSKILTELIPYNDCFYRNMYNYKYIALLDIDEIIVPRKDNDWYGLMSRIQSHIKPGSRFASYNARNVYFLDTMTPDGVYSDIPPYMHMLQHTYRSKNFTLPGWYVKSFFDTNVTISCHNHLPISHAKGSFKSYNIDLEDGYMHHYRHSCALELKSDDYREHVKDARLWDFRDAIIKKVNKACGDLGFFRPE